MTSASLSELETPLVDDHRKLSSSILVRIAEGDDSAVEQCVDTFGTLVWSLARRYLASEADADDATQEIFVELWQQAHRYDSSISSEATFIAMIARRRLIDRQRRMKSVPFMEPLEADVHWSESHSVDHSLELAEEAAKAAECLEKLPVRQRRVLVMSLQNCVAHSSIADSLQMPLGTVKTLARRGLLMVRDCMKRGILTTASPGGSE